MRRRVFRLICGLFPVLTIATAALAGQPTVTHWFSGPYATYEFVKKQIPGFERANPDVRIELLYVNPNDVFEKYLVMFATGVAVDVIWTNNTYNLPYYVSRNFLLPLNNIARKYEFGFSDFVRPVVERRWGADGADICVTQPVERSTTYTCGHPSLSEVKTTPFPFGLKAGWGCVHCGP